MAKLPASLPLLVDRFGPRLHEVPPEGWLSSATPDRIVETHCCFCGQQCGIRLKVHRNKVVGFEPWDEFPFNRGKLCPKGSSATCRTSIPTGPDPLAREGVGLSHFRGTRRSIERPRKPAHPDPARHDAFAILSGAPHQREAYPWGSSPVWPCAPRTSTTTAASAWCRCSGIEEDPGSIEPQIPGVTSRRPRSC